MAYNAITGIWESDPYKSWLRDKREAYLGSGDEWSKDSFSKDWDKYEANRLYYNKDKFSFGLNKDQSMSDKLGLSNKGNYNPTEGYSGMFKDSRFTESPGVPIKAGIEKTYKGLKSFIQNPATQIGFGGLVGGYNAYKQAEQERKSVLKSNQQIGKAITGLGTSRTGIINRTTADTGSLMNMYAMNADKNKDQGYLGMYGTQVGGMRQSVDRIDSDVAKLKTAIQRVPSKSNLWTSAFTGALGGMFGVGGLLDSWKNKKYYDSK